MKDILVAGGSGFLGSHLCEALISRGDRVTVVDDLSSGREENLASIADKIKFIREDVTRVKIDDRFDFVINMASRASRGEWEKYPVDIALSNSLGSQNLIELAMKSDALYLFASTSEVYGNPEVVPTPESYVARIDPLGSRAPYDESKRFGETLVRSYETQYGLKSIIIRLFNTYGPRMRGGDLYGRVIDRFIQQATSSSNLTIYGDGNQTRSFTFVDDTIKGIILLMEKGKLGEVYNIGNDEEIKIRELADVIIKVTQSTSSLEYLPLPPDDPRRRAANISKMRLIGWEPVVGLEEGVRGITHSFR